ASLNPCLVAGCLPCSGKIASPAVAYARANLRMRLIFLPNLVFRCFGSLRGYQLGIQSGTRQNTTAPHAPCTDHERLDMRRGSRCCRRSWAITGSFEHGSDGAFCEVVDIRDLLVGYAESFRCD